MKILLVFPEYPETFWSFKHALRFIFKKTTNPPLGLLTVASMIPDEWDKRLVDMNVDNLTDRDIAWADYVFISATTIQKKSVASIITRCKTLKVKIVAGGPLFTSYYDEYEDVDYLVLNEAEITFPEFLRDLRSGQARHLYCSRRWANLEQTPVPAWKLLKLKKYASMSIQYSRGCPFACDFCDIPLLYGHRPRVKHKKQIIAELESLYAHGWRGTVFFVDDNFIGNKNDLKKEILPTVAAWMQKKRYPFTFITQASVNLADDDELMDLMVEAGFNTVFVGIETPDEGSLSECGKRQNTNRDLVACVKKIQSAGLQVQGGFIVGFDHDTLTIFERQIQFIQESGIVTAMVGLLNAVRGTALYQRLQKENRLLAVASGDNTDCSINFMPKMRYSTLIEGYKRIVKTIYSPDHFYARVRKFLEEYRPLQKGLPRVKIYEVKAFIMSIIMLGIKGKERLHYWRLFLWCIFSRPHLTPLAVTFAIYGFHFRKVFERIA
ncbi:radical SAM protein [candidate division WOR_3 bacterium SM23_60]|uniref:Radical SAM protein n=1 Tax=candidate division WOR_3 bacterium SM23_60 TaxID=1703780 RepID=A0A0S8GB52_UNCW3|nr:MAG: radical SAM protein [candidate division WOR_3 bacterium SM23_60]